MQMKLKRVRGEAWSGMFYRGEGILSQRWLKSLMGSIVSPPQSAKDTLKSCYLGIRPFWGKNKIFADVIKMREGPKPISRFLVRKENFGPRCTERHRQENASRRRGVEAAIAALGPPARNTEGVRKPPEAGREAWNRCAL